MYIQYKNYRIHHATAKDVEQLVTWWNDGSIMEHAGFPLGLQTNAEKVFSQIQQDTDDTHRRLLLEIDKQAIGEMSYSRLEDDKVEIGIKICSHNYQNQGHGKVFLSMLIETLFEKGYHQIVLDTMIENTRAQHVYETLGFMNMRMKRNNWQDQMGNLRSAIDYALISERFKSVLDHNELLLMSIDEKDCESIIKEAHELIYTYEDLSTIDINYVLNWTSNKIINHQPWYFKIRKDFCTVGYFGIRKTEDGYELEDLYILEPYRGQGIGSQLMKHIIETYPGKLELCVFRKNHRAVSLYKRFGFDIVEEKPTRLFMRKEEVRLQ